LLVGHWWLAKRNAAFGKNRKGTSLLVPIDGTKTAGL
jgi:hypothetical protein